MKILAVSGGIDSVVMLHFLRAGDEDGKPIVAHFDHGIRGNSLDDAKFVERLAHRYGLKFECRHAKLGQDCSEATARQERYDFLFELADKYHGEICVAHHREDILESIAINVLRGTGWRGLTPMNAPQIQRPLKTWTKSNIYRYATENNLSFRLDQTNNETKYLRNRVRERLLFAKEEQRAELFALYERQLAICNEIDAVVDQLAEGDGTYRKALLDCDIDIAIEILRNILAKKQVSLTRPQLQKSVESIRSFLPGKRISIGPGRFIAVGRYSFKIML